MVLAPASTERKAKVGIAAENKRESRAIEIEEHIGLGGEKGLFPTGHATYAITPFIPMEQLRWYRLVIQGQETATAAGSRHQSLV